LLRVRLRKGEAGLQKESDVMVDQIRAIDNARFRQKTGEAGRILMNELREKLISILDLD
jgi:mRNA interferase MazF